MGILEVGDGEEEGEKERLGGKGSASCSGGRVGGNSVSAGMHMCIACCVLRAVPRRVYPTHRRLKFF